MLPTVLRSLCLTMFCSLVIGQESTNQAAPESISTPKNHRSSIFNGVDLSGWSGKTNIWSVANGEIVGETTSAAPLKQNTFLVWKDEVADFVLEFDFLIEGGTAEKPTGNSGVQYRSKVLDPEEFVLTGYQADIDHAGKYSGILYEEKGRGIVALRGERVTLNESGEKEVERFAEADELGRHIKADQWNHYKVVANGASLSHYINDQLMSQVIDEQVEKCRRKGVLGLQVHTGPPMKIRFKNLFLADTLVGAE